MTSLDDLVPPNGLFLRLRDAAGEDWRGYVEHVFVARLAEGDLPEACFRRYLVQDYLFLIHLVRVYALAAYKAETMGDIRQAADAMKALLEVELGLHLEFCAGWGLDEAALVAAPEAEETMAYTRYVLERGMAGDLLDLHVAIAPCILGYAEIGRRIAREKAGGLAANPYRAWVEMYAGGDYAEVARVEAEQLDSLLRRRTGRAADEIDGDRWASLVTTFRQACRLEAAFWQMGLNTA